MSNTKKTFSRRALLRTLIYSTIALSGSTAYATSDNLEILHTDVPIEGLPAALDGFTIGVMSDFHAGALGNNEVCLNAIQAMHELKPDMITLAGDFVDGANSHDAENIHNSMFLFQELETLNAPFGVFAVLGNHDHWADSKHVTELLTAKNIPVLNNRNIRLANGLILAGVDDLWEGPGDIRKALRGVESEKHIIMLSHNPDINEDLIHDSSVSLVISGHTHGGQIRAPISHWAPWVPCGPRYTGKTGLIFETAQRRSFISKGVGTFLLPLRLFCPPDVAVLHLRSVKV